MINKPSLETTAGALALAIILEATSGCKAKAEAEASTETKNPSAQAEAETSEETKADGDDKVIVKTSSKVESIPTPAPDVTEAPDAEPTPAKTDVTGLKLRIDLSKMGTGKHEINVNLDPETRKRLLDCVTQLGGKFDYTIDARQVSVEAKDVSNDSQRGEEIAIRMKNKGKAKPVSQDIVAEAVDKCEEEVAKQTTTPESK